MCAQQNEPNTPCRTPPKTVSGFILCSPSGKDSMENILDRGPSKNKNKTWKVMGWPSVKFIQDRQFTFLPPTCLLLGSGLSSGLADLGLKSVVVLSGGITVVLLKVTMFCVITHQLSTGNILMVFSNCFCTFLPVPCWYGDLCSTESMHTKSVCKHSQTCLAWKSPFLSQFGMGIVKRSSCVRVFDANLSNALCSSARHGACQGNGVEMLAEYHKQVNAVFCCGLK